MNSEMEPLLPPTPSLLSLPDDIVNNCLARIPKSYYPKLSLVCKTFRSLILSYELRMAQVQLKTKEKVLFVCLQLPDLPLPSWFSIWIKPDQTLTNDIEKKKKKNSTGNTLLVPTPSSYTPRVPYFMFRVGSDVYSIRQDYTLSQVKMWVSNKPNLPWREAPHMTVVARANLVACVLNGKIYVMGGCAANESKNWAEVFDTKTQTWETLPDPGLELRLSNLKEIYVMTKGKLCVTSTVGKDYVYDPKEGKWDTEEKLLLEYCVIDNVLYRCPKQSCHWYDPKHKRKGVVKGLDMLVRNPSRDLIEIVNYGGKLLILWDEDCCQQKDIWCALIALETLGDEVWGNIEWDNVVRTVPSSYAFVRSSFIFE